MTEVSKSIPPTPKRPHKNKSKAHQKPVICPYCGAQALLRPVGDLFEEPYRRLNNFWVCVKHPECDAYTAAHLKDDSPMGPLANAGLRFKRMQAHYYFDQLWRSGIFSRNAAYRWLGDALGVKWKDKQPHISQMSDVFCDIVIRESQAVLQNHKGKVEMQRGVDDDG